MKKRNPFFVALIPFVTFGIYGLYWLVKTKTEMNIMGAEIPTAWLLIVPVANIYWYWKYSEGIEKISKEKLTGVISFILLLLLSTIGMAVIQDTFNKIS